MSIKYVGSKNRIAKFIVPILQSIIDEHKIVDYVEPFVGGGNIIDKIKCENKYGFDNNEYLIALFQAIQSGYTPPNILTKSEYDNIKNNKDKFSSELVAVAGLLATYNSKWFGGYSGEVTTKIGTVRNYYNEAVRNLLKQKPNLMNVKFNHRSYDELPLYQNALIYCDPPYENTTKYKGSFDSNLFWTWIREQSKSSYVIVSEYSAPDDFKCIWSKTITTTLDKNSRSKPTEKLFIYKNGLLKSEF